jgi:hypothetical protein
MEELLAFGPLYAFPIAGWIGTPVSLGLAWWFWARVPNRPVPNWRAHVFLAGLALGTVNVVMACSWVTYRLCAGPRPEVWKLKDTCGNVGIYLALGAMVTAPFGLGRACGTLLCCGIFGS